MTRIQAELEAELLSYSDVLFEDTIFPERLLFPMRWILQNAVRFYAHPQLRAKQMVRERVLRTMFGDGSAKQVEKRLLSRERLSELIGAPDYERQSVAEDIAERIMVERHDEIMMFYERTLRSFFVAHQVAGDHYEWLLAGVTASPSAARSRPANVAPAAVWESGDFVIDIERGQAVQVRKTSDDS